jgi:hypothetical protein
MTADLGGKDGEGAANEADSAVGVVTGASTFDHVEPAAQLLFPALAAVAGDERFEGLGDGGQSVGAGPALAGGLCGQPAGYGCGGPQAT